MRTTMILSALTIMVFMPHTAFADEFGERFHSEAPRGLGEYTAPESEIPAIAMDDAAKDVQEIMPAAGDDAEKIMVEPTAEDITPE